jgi:predicted kinase
VEFTALTVTAPTMTALSPTAPNQEGPAMPRLVLINGAPGSGKSTMAQTLAQERAMTLALDVDVIKHSLGRWDEDPSASGLHARRLALALAEGHLSAGYDVVLGQYLARTPFIEDLAALAERLDARFFEFVLDLDAATLAVRLASRVSDPQRPEHVVNNQLVGPADAARLVASIEGLRQARPGAIWVDARGPASSTLDLLRAALEG